MECLSRIYHARQETMERANRISRGKSPTTQAWRVRPEEIHHVREGKHGARSPQQAIAIGLSKARGRRRLAAPKRERFPRRRARAPRAPMIGARCTAQAQAFRPSIKSHPPSAGTRRSHAASGAALSRQTKAAARHRTAADRSAAAQRPFARRGTLGFLGGTKGCSDARRASIDSE